MRRTAASLVLALMLPLPGLAGDVVVKPGDTLSEIAERYGTTVERLKQLNGLRNDTDLWAGSRIQVPGAGGVTGAAAAPSGSGNYTVKSGETLSEIAERYGTTVERLKQLNGLRNDTDLWAGSRIQVPGASPAVRSANSRTPLNRNAREHMVQPGETLSEIAELYDVPMSRLVALNGLSSPDSLEAGSKLRLRSATTARPPAAPRPPQRPRPTATAGRPAPSAPRPSTTTQPATASRPAASSKPTAVAATRPAGATTVTPTPAASRPTRTATATPAPATTLSTATTTTTTTTTTTVPAATTATTATPKPAAPKPGPTQPTTTAAATTARPAPAAAPVRTATTAGARPAGRPASPDWRSYGPLQVDWANWQPMAGSYVAPSLNSEGQPLYLAINCSARRLNATGQSGTWKTWDAPQSDFEEQLISDLCKTKGS
jgi:LysM repeat protein